MFGFTILILLFRNNRIQMQYAYLYNLRRSIRIASNFRLYDSVFLVFLKNYSTKRQIVKLDRFNIKVFVTFILKRSNFTICLFVL